MSVVKSKRKTSRFEAQHQLLILRNEVTNLAINQFGFSAEKYELQIKRYAEQHKTAANVDAVVERWRNKKDNFTAWFIAEEREVVLEILRRITEEFTVANSIFPNGADEEISKAEITERRLHMDRAIAQCFVLKQEIQYVMKVLPVDMNKFKRFADMIDTEITLIKGVRRSDNRFLKNQKGESVKS